MYENANEQSGNSVKTNTFAHYDKFQFAGIERRLNAGEYVYPDEIAVALEKYGDYPLPEAVKSYLCSDLRRELKAPKGRRAVPEIIKKQHAMFARVDYRNKLTWLQKRLAHNGHLNGWPSIQKANFWQGTPSEKAARMTARKFSHGAESWRTILNMISSQE